MIPFIVLVSLNIISAFSNTPLEIRNTLKDITTKHPTAHPQCLSSYFVKFINTHELSDNTETANNEELANLVSIVDENANVDDVKNLWSFYSNHLKYMEKVRSRNSLSYYLHNNPVSSSLDIASLLTNFFETYKPTRDDVISLKNFVNFIRSIDARADYASIRKIYRPVFLYQKYLDRKPTRLNLLEEIGKTSDNINTMIPKLRSFITSYGYLRKDVSEFNTFKSLFYNSDYGATDEDTKKIHPIVARYSFISAKAASRDKLERRIGIKMRNVYDIKDEIADFIKNYNLVDMDLSDEAAFKSNIRDQDYLASEARLPSIHIHVFKYYKYLYMKQITELALDFFENNKEITKMELSDYLDPFIAVFNLFDINPKNADELKTHVRLLIGTFSRPEAVTIYSRYAEYLKYLEYTESRDVLVSMIDLKPDMDLAFLISPMQKFYRLYELKSKDVSDVDKFGAVLRERDPDVSDFKITTLLPFVMIYIKYINRKTVFDRLVSRLNPQTPSQSVALTDEQKAIISETLTIDELLDKLIEFFDFKKEHYDFASEFYKFVKKLYRDAGDNDIKRVFDNLIKYKKYKDYIQSLNKPSPGDVLPDGSIAKPTNGDQLFWYDFFKFFGGEPHVVTKVKKIDELFVFKRWFNAVYKYLTGIHYYITPEIINSKESSSKGGNQQPKITVARSR